jgi:DNA-directed RNA polymerase alpha subunit
VPNIFYEVVEGHINGLRLPRNAWAVLQKEGITTIGQLRAMADRLHRLDGIGVQTKQVIQDELARLAACRGSGVD